MSEQKHTQEPWHTHDELIHASRPGIAGFHYAVADTFMHAGIDRPTMIANAKRIVACVNACKGISTEALEAGAIKELIDDLGIMLDQLRVNELELAPAGNVGHFLDAAAAARAVIVKMEGKQ